MCCIKIILLCTVIPILQVSAVSDNSFYADKVRPLLNKYCYDCHDPDDEDSESPFLEDLRLADLSKNRHVWRSVAAQIRNRTMPPKRKKKQPTEIERIELANWIDAYLRKSALKMPEYAGAVLSRRLNRDEYNNTIRDLVGLDLDLSYSFPMDGGGGEGFDNNGETLFLPPLLMEKYLETAQKILNRTVVIPELKLSFDAKNLIDENSSPLVLRKIFSIYQVGNYEISLSAENTQTLDKLTMKVDGVQEALKFVKTSAKSTVRLSRGIHEVVFTLHNSNESIKKLSIKSLNRPPTKSKLESHKRIFKVPAGDSPSSKRNAAFENLKIFVSRAFRRPARDSELKLYTKLYDRSIKRGDPYEEAVKLALKAVLISPRFLFMVEGKAKSPGIVPISDYELATRLSYFLWGSMPDEELFTLAKQKKLQNPAYLKAQVKRMLSDKKAQFFFTKFTGQWLGTKDVGLNITPNIRGIGYSSKIGTALREEAPHLSQYIFMNNKSLLDFIDADYVIVNETLAKHYGIEGIKGDDFQFCQVNNGQRGGILGLGGVHLLTSFPNRTSPILRGVWVIETILGTPVPPPPDNVPELNVTKHQKKQTIRQMFEAHRKNDACAACHNLIDPIGFGLENYNLIGKWRTEEGGKPLDSSGIMPSGESFDGPKQLKSVILNEKDSFIKHLSSKVLGYALGRSIRMEDSGTIERILDTLKEHDYSSQKLIELIVLSTPFRNRQIIQNRPVRSEGHK